MKTLVFTLIVAYVTGPGWEVARAQATPPATNAAPPAATGIPAQPQGQTGAAARPARPLPPTPPTPGTAGVGASRAGAMRSALSNRVVRPVPPASAPVPALANTNIALPRSAMNADGGLPASAPTPARVAPAATPTAPSGPTDATAVQPAVNVPGGTGPAAAMPGRTNVVIVPGGTNVIEFSPSGKIPEKIINLQVAPIEQVLNYYALLTGRSVLRPANLPAASITFRNEQELSAEEAVQALEAVLGLNQITMINVGDKFVSAVPTQQALQEGAAFSTVDAKLLPEAGQFVTKVVSLKYALPSETAQLLQGFGKVQNGIVPIDSTMTLVLRDYPANIKRMSELIEQVDVKVESDYKLEVIPIKYGKVEDVYSTMSSLVGGTGGGGVGLAPGAATGTATTGMTGVRRTGTTRGTTGRGMSTRYGTGYGTGYGSGYSGFAGYGSSRQRGVYTPQAAATTPVGGGTTSFSQRLQQMVSRMGGQPGELELLKDARIVPDQRSNSLIVYATKEDMAMITNILDKVDRLMAQVMIEAIIMDVELSDSYSLGVSALLQPQKSGDLTYSASNNGGAGLLSSITNLSGSLPDGFNYWGRFNGDLDFAFKAISSRTKGHVLATPRVQTSHAMTATFDVSEAIPYVGSYPGSYGGSYGYYSQAMVNFADVTTMLSVTPYITPDGLVVMEVDQTISEVTAFLEMPNAGKAPSTTSRSTSTTVSVRSGDTVILGGYIRTQKSRSKSGVPVLKEIPIMGALFRSTSQDGKRSELVVMLRPVVLSSPEEAARIAVEEKERLPGVREMEKEMHDDEIKRQERSDRATGRKKKQTGQ